MALVSDLPYGGISRVSISSFIAFIQFGKPLLRKLDGLEAANLWFFMVVWGTQKSGFFTSRPSRQCCHSSRDMWLVHGQKPFLICFQEES